MTLDRGSVRWRLGRPGSVGFVVEVDVVGCDVNFGLVCGTF